ncbi:DUF58 domain-containing protein [Halopseudomonas oceani]|uniref:DUF58 domain-containing protein n=1 Tax=Halopseudomonas oceani TaxID=1708783 RepID=UPI002AA73CE6|nr:DUF58 domain-containing protein [Halopseudomonas oceani]
MNVGVRSRLRQWHRGWLRRRIPPAQQIRLDHRRIFIIPSKAGGAFLLLLAIMLVGAINYQNSLVYGLTFTLLSLFWVALHHTYRNLGGVQLKATGGRPVFAGEQAPLSLVLSSMRREHQALRLSWPEVATHTVDIPAAGEQAVTLYHPTRRRGWLPLERLRIETVYPLGWFQAWSLLDLDWQVLVYPKPVKCPLPRGSAPDGAEHDQDQMLVEGVDDFQGLRAYQPGDSRRRLDWRAWSRGQGLHSKVFAEPQQQSLWLNLGDAPGRDLDERLGVMTGWVLALETDRRPYGLSLPGQQIEPALGDVHRERCLRALALYGPGVPT